MCIAILSLGDDAPTRAELVQSCRANADGFGYCLIVLDANGCRQAITYNTMNAAGAVDSYLARLEHYAGRVEVHAFHARIATHGSVNVENTHPFQVPGELSFVIHNGILDVDRAVDDWRSDTRVFAEDVLPLFGGAVGLGDTRVSKVLDAYVLDNWSKVLVLSAEEGAPSVTMLGEELGHWDPERAVWYSNTSYQARPVSQYAADLKAVAPGAPRIQVAYDTFAAPAARSVTDTWRWDDDILEADADRLERDCVNGCGGVLDVYHEDYCPVCTGCQACGYDKVACLCWGPHD